MKTPITDRLASPASNFIRNAHVIHVSHARKLETDRAVLINALDELVRLSNESDGFEYGTLSASFVRTFAKEAISAIENNFPYQP